MLTSTRAARATWAAHYATPNGFRYMPAEEVVRFCGRRGDLGRVLEVGCGNGANLWYLAERSPAVVGIDFCDTALRAAWGLLQSRNVAASLAMASAHQLPFAAQTFETVIDAMVSQHVPWLDHAALYREYRRVLKPGGVVLLYHLVHGTTGTVPQCVDYPEGIALFPEAGWMCLPRRDDLAAALTAAGFASVEARGMEREYPDGDRARYAVLEGHND